MLAGILPTIMTNYGYFSRLLFLGPLLKPFRFFFVGKNPFNHLLGSVMGVTRPYYSYAFEMVWISKCTTHTWAKSMLFDEAFFSYTYLFKIVVAWHGKQKFISTHIHLKTVSSFQSEDRTTLTMSGLSSFYYYSRMLYTWQYTTFPDFILKELVLSTNFFFSRYIQICFTCFIFYSYKRFVQLAKTKAAVGF